MRREGGGGSDDTDDAALGGAVRLIQPRRGYRFSLDAVLLARFAAERPARSVLDLGCGCGVVGLSLLALGGAGELTGVDVQPDMVARARRGAEANGWGDRCRFLSADLRDARALLPPQSFDLAVANPPYHHAAQGRVSPDPATAAARHELAGGLEEFAAAAAWCLGARGAFCVVYPAPRLAALFAACRGARLEPKVLRLLHPRAGRPAGLALLRCVKGAGEGLEVRPPLILHGDAEGRRYSEEAEALLGPPGSVSPARPAPGPAAGSP